MRNQKSLYGIAKKIIAGLFVSSGVAYIFMAVGNVSFMDNSTLISVLIAAAFATTIICMNRHESEELYWDDFSLEVILISIFIIIVFIVSAVYHYDMTNSAYWTALGYSLVLISIYYASEEVVM